MSELTDDTQTARVLTSLTDTAPEKLQQLRSRLAAEARASGLLDAAFCVTDSPVGRLLIAATGTGIVRVAFESEGFDTVLEQLGAAIGTRIFEAPQDATLDAARQQLDEYFATSRRTFELPLDDRLASGFRRLVQRSLPRIGYGTTRTYKEVAEFVGNPRAVRAVGTACATNPLPIVVPCHRVLRTDGTIGGYLGGPDAKRTLLDMERLAA